MFAKRHNLCDNYIVFRFNVKGFAQFKQISYNCYIETGVKLLKQGQVLCIFPEGGLKPSKDIRRGYTGATRFALLSQSPIIPIGIKNSFDIFPCHKKFPNFKKICEARIGQPMFFKEYCGLDHNIEILQEITDKVMGEAGRLIKQE